MFDLFRFFMLRPPEKSSDDAGISIAGGSAFHAQLAQARAGVEPLAAMRGIAEAFANSQAFVSQPEKITHGAALNTLDASLSAHPHTRLADLKSLVRGAFNESANAVATSQTFLSDKTRVQDSLVAIKLASPAVQTDLEHLPRFARLIDLVERAAADDFTLNDSGAIAQALGRLLILPPDLFPLPSPLEQRKTQDPAGNTNQSAAAAVQEAEKRVAAVEGALADVASVNADEFSRAMATPQPPHVPPPPPQSVGFFAQLFNLTDSAFSRQAQAVSSASSRPAAAGRLTLNSEAIARFEPGTQSVLRELKLDLSATPAPAAVRALRSELATAQQSLAAKRAALQPIAGGAGDPRLPQQAFDFKIPGGGPQPLPIPIPIPVIPIPAIHGYIKPVGMADLLVVKYQLLRYERGEVAYIENILKGENSQRSVRRLETTEETTVVETENTKEEERDLQSTERFELKDETENTVTAEGNLKSGNAFSPSYGPMLEFQGGTSAPVAGSQSQSSRQASNYSREVTSRSASKVTERVRKQETIRKLREFEEKTSHTFDNTLAGGANVTGVYQWLEKVLRGQVFNYGRRLMFDIMVPEPAAFVQQAITGSSPAALGLVRPPDFKLGIDNINEGNYSNLAAFYGATGIEPPPLPWITVAKTFASQSPIKTNAALSIELPIPDGYQAHDGWATADLSVFSGDWSIDLAVGGWVTRVSNSNVGGFSFPLYNETLAIAISADLFHVETYAILIEITCYRTPRHLQGWQSRTHDAILRASQQRIAEYEEKLANLQATTRITSLAQNPDENRKIIREELKKSCISVFTYQHFDLFSAVELSPQGYVQIKINDAAVQGSFIRFFEQAFEWEQMIYLFYPYFWGTKFFWLFKLRIDEVDPLFKDFLKAGEARVTVPVRPGFEKAVAHYLETGEIWNGVDPLDITSETYLPILKEIQERDAVPGAEIPYGDPWEVRLPTTLVSLRADGKLPKWKEEPPDSGKWVEEDPE